MNEAKESDPAADARSMATLLLDDTTSVDSMTFPQLRDELLRLNPTSVGHVR